jgi:hypothetical protein
MSYLRIIKDNYKCYSYDFNWYDFFIPSFYEVNKLCKSTDKTFLFIVVSLRSFFYFAIFYYLNSQNLINLKGEEIKIFGFVMFFLIFFINIVSLVLIYIKKQKIPKIYTPMVKEDKEHIPIKIPKRLPKTKAEIDLDKQIKEELNKRADQLAAAIASHEARIRGDAVEVLKENIKN